MKTNLSKSQAEEKINLFFQKDFSSEEMRKIKRLAMKFKISLKSHKTKFCKSCLSPLKGKIRITKTHKTITCSCGFKNKIKIKK